ncbi:MAG: family 20 glycosylhydrolase [Muribaculaceae bacterium]|nr:family 20 glycosylhydrolase [Muribaculaceae bacterium]
MKKNRFMTLALAAVVAMGAQTKAQSPLAVRWEMGQNEAEPGYYSSRFVLKNVSGDTLRGNWEFFFNQFSRSLKLPAGSPVDIKEVSSTYYHMTPNAAYKPLKPGDSLVVEMLMRGTMVSICYVPQGGHVVLDGAYSQPLAVNIKVAELKDHKQWENRQHDYPDGNYMYAFNEKLKGEGCCQREFRSFDIFPSPKTVDYGTGTTEVGNLVTIKTKLLKGGIKKARKLLVSELAQRGIYESGNQRVKIWLDIDKKLNNNSEYYELTVKKDSIVIKGASQVGLMNGVKTLVAALDHSAGHRLNWATVKDAPDFGYRGFMLDIARNFTSFDNLKRFIDLLSYYKINRLQFHFTDDEAWRVEMPSIPELTEVASRRGCTLDENGFLAQIFDGNGNPNDLSQSANGYLTRAQMVELLKYADARGIKVIPEIETPGHARAAIVAMRNRYARYAATNKLLAEQYKLWDDDDKPDFTSAQRYHDNVLNVAQDGVYNFLQTVVEDLAKMYKDAGLKLDILHLGGDEVANGAWNGSPAVQALMAREGLKTQHDVHEYYLRRISDYLVKKGIKIEGWQEVAMNNSAAFNAVMTQRIAGVNAWSTVGRRDTVPYTLANAGYPVILSNVTNFYIDMAYSWHQYERGLHWGGTVDEYATWYAQPYDIYRSARVHLDGTSVDMENAAVGKMPLRNVQNIIGVQGQLWAETIRSFEQVQMYCLPKMLGLSERGWNAIPEFVKNGAEQDYEGCLRSYNQKIGRNELPVLKRRGYAFRLGQPGIVVKDGKLLANSQYCGEVIRYTLDGTEPDATSPVWTGPVTIGKGVKLIKAKAMYLGRESLTTYLWLE